MAKLKDHIIKQEEHSRMVREALRKRLNERHEATLRLNNSKHRIEKHQSTQTWSEDMPDLEGQALADAEKQFDYDSWLGEREVKSRYEKCGEVGCSFCDAGD